MVIDALCDTYNDWFKNSEKITEIYNYSNEELATHPIFKPFSVEALHSDNASAASQAALEHKRHVLAYSVPALSHAAGSTVIKKDKFDEKTFNMQADMKGGNNWPRERGSKPEDKKWFHSDAKDVAYRYVFPLYDKWIKLGSLDK